MFAFLSKKIAIPGGVRLRCIAWNSDQGWIAIGGDDALLKVLRLDGGRAPAAGASGEPGKALSQNQTLQGHSGAVVCATWNHVHNKLTTSDENGLIIVWSLYNDAWFEEMINNRNKGAVRDMRWTAAGDKICIAYDDGAVIVGSVDGNRLWGKELGLRLSLLHWSPDGRFLLFATDAGEVHAYDGSGNAVARLQLYCNEGLTGACRVVGIEWYDASRGLAEPDCPTLALALDNGRLQLMRHDADDSAVCIDTGIRPAALKWNHNGSVLAVSGHQAAPDRRQLWLVQFYSPGGEHLRTLRVPGAAPGGIASMAWEGTGLRLGLACEASIFFTSVRPSHQWGVFAGDTLVYAFGRPDRPEQCVVFWGGRASERYAKVVKRVACLAAAGELALLVTKGEAPGEHLLILCNAIGSPVDSKKVDMEPKFAALTDTCAIVASEELVHVWQFRSGLSRQPAGTAGASPVAAASAGTGSAAAAKLQREGQERAVHIDAPGNAQVPELLKPSQPAATTDPITAITALGSSLLVGRSSGVVQGFGLPSLSPGATHLVRCHPARLALNCDASRLAVIDFAGLLTCLDLTAPVPSAALAAAGGAARGEHLAIERKDVWDCCWASDDPELLAVMEKARLVVLRGIEAEEPVPSSCWLAGFSDLCVRGVALDAIMQQPDAPELSMLVDYETHSLRHTRALLAAGSEAEAQEWIAANPHPRLWRLLSEHALERLDLAAAERGFVHCADYAGLQLVRRLAQLGDADKQRAEVAIYFGRFDEAEGLFQTIGRPDLALAMRGRLGDWFAVERLLRAGAGGAAGDDAALLDVSNRIGAYYSDRQNWAKAAQYYTQARNTGQLVSCFYRLEDYSGLVKLAGLLPDGDPLLADIGAKLQSVGLCSDAVAALLRFGDAKAAVDCCVQLHQWDQALALAQAHHYHAAEGLLQQYAGHLLEKRAHLDAVQLYRKAQRHSEAARLLVDAAAQLAARRGPPLRIKQLYVLAALEVEAHRDKALAVGGGDGAAAAATLLGAATGTGSTASAGPPGSTSRGGLTTRTAAASRASVTQAATAASQTLAGLMTLEAATDAGGELRGLDGNAWRGAEAYHFWLLAHQQLYAGQVDAALRTALSLRRYDSVLQAVDVYALLALVAFYSGFYGTCSKAFVKLESLAGVPQERRDAFADLALRIFTQHAPADPHSLAEGREARGGARHDGLGLDDAMSDRDQVCVASGRALRDEPRLRCRTCKRAMLVAELSGRRACPLCHSVLPSAQEASGGGTRSGGGRPPRGALKGARAAAA